MANGSGRTVERNPKKAKILNWTLLLLAVYFVLQVYFVRELLAAELVFGFGFFILLLLGGVFYLVGAIGERGLDLTEAGVRVIADSVRQGYSSLDKTSRPIVGAPVVSQVVAEGPSSGPTPAIRSQIFDVYDVYIDGEAQGRFHLAHARITVGPNGRLRADIEASEIFVDGTVQGNLKASERVSFGPSSSAKGTILTPRLTIENGADLHTEIEILLPDSPKKSAVDLVIDRENGSAQVQKGEPDPTHQKRVA